MDELHELCSRLLGGGEPAGEAAAVARQAAPAGGRIELLSAAVRACRDRAAEAHAPEPVARSGDPQTLARTAAAELAAATAQLPSRQREALALRELLRLSHEQIAEVLEIEPAATAPLLARARLGLRAKLRGAAHEPAPDCAERERALRCLVHRQDSEPLSSDDDDWLIEHLGACGECDRAHSAMLEASVCYRATRQRRPR